MTKRDGSENDHERDEMTNSATSSSSSSESEQSTPEEQTTPDDELSAIRADDALLDALSGSDPGTADRVGDEELNALLLAWRRDVDSEPLPELVDTSTAATTVRAAALASGRRGRARRRLLVVPAAAAAAVLAIGFTGTALAARDAQPGDTLWGLSKVLYADHARTIEAAASVRIDLQNAYLAIAQERYDDARRSLAEAERALNQVPVEGELVQLKARHTQLMERLEQPEGAATPTTSSSSTASEPSTATGTESSQTPTTSSPSVRPSPSTDPSTGTTSEPPTSTSTPTTSSPTGDSTNSESGGTNPRFGASVPGVAVPTD